MDLNAFWFRNNLLKKTDGVNHIADIINNPTVFGLSKKEIEKIYKKYNEKLPFEGKAREEIISSIMNKGWIRIRERETKEGKVWTIQFDDYDKRKHDLKELVKSLLYDKPYYMNDNDDVILMDTKGKFIRKFSKYNGSSISVFCENRNSSVRIVEDYKEFIVS